MLLGILWTWKKVSEVCCTSIVYATDKKHTKVECPEARIYEETLNILLYESRNAPDQELMQATSTRGAVSGMSSYTVMRRRNEQQNGTIWYTDGSKTEKNTGACATNRDPGCEISINLGNLATVFWAEITAISACAQEMTRRSYTNKRIQIISDSQAALKALGAVEIHSQEEVNQ
ncbi:hypothetical protein NQ318_007083 [Aromia moschata]|uniref:RNase H type-1 domain-containing protein n=1 Tax=Aromia moschata TaxID=1265417 RepID=A0AAV8XE26_9CUCU|nr:hypothetical protein NQ318_007083 [Aromia moschata]